MRLILETFSTIPASQGGRKAAVLADMKELGADSKLMHGAMITSLNPEIITDLFLYGEDMEALYVYAREIYPPNRVHYFVKNADKDQFGNPIETELNIFYKTEKQIMKHSKELVEDFPAEEAEEYADTERINEYDLGYITDFSKIFIFGVDGADCQFCMDFSVGEEPRIIFWDDAELTWRVIANTIEDFFALFHKE